MRFLSRLASHVSLSRPRRVSNRMTRRSLLRGAEALEPRLTMACDVGDPVLFTPRSLSAGAADVNRDGLVSPLDAVLVANAVHACGAASGPTIAAAASDRFMLDVSGNGVIGGEDFDGIVSKLGDSRRQKTTEPAQLMSEEDPYVTVFISNADEGGVVLGGNDPGTLQVSLGLSQMLPYEVTVDFAIQPLTATADEDFELLPGGMLTGTITFPAYQDTDEFTIYTIPDYDIEPDETLKVTLSNPSGAVLHPQYYTATGTIYNDDFNLAPSAVDDGTENEYWTFDQSQLYVSANEGVLLNDIDYDDRPSPLTAVLYEQPEQGTLALNSDGSFTYTPKPGFFGFDTFRYQANDGVALSPPATVTIALNVLTIEARARGSWDWQIVGSSFDGVGLVPFPPPVAWVGQAIDLQPGTLGPIPVQFPTTQWTVQGKTVADWYGNIHFSTEVPFADELTQQQAATVHWVDNGVKQVQVQVTVGGGRPAVTASGNINVKRPVANATTVTEPVSAWVAGPYRAVQFGDADDPQRGGFGKDGITFTWHADASAGGNYQWVQLIERNAMVTNNDGSVEFWSTNGSVLDIAPNTLDDEYWASRDNPYGDPPAWGVAGAIQDIDVIDDFQTYLMWKFGGVASANSIWVPICVTSWYWHGDASFTSGAWSLISSPDDHSQNPFSIDTTNYPVWTTNIQDAFRKQ